MKNLSALVFSLSLSGCATLYLIPEGNIECFNKGNPEGYAVRSPKILCPKGWRAHYIVYYDKDGKFVKRFHLESGIYTKSIKWAKSSNPKSIEELTIDGVRIEPKKKYDKHDREFWKSANKTFAETWKAVLESHDRFLGECINRRVLKSIKY